MKKSSATIVITVAVIVLFGVLYIGNSFYQKSNTGGSSRVENIKNEDVVENAPEDFISGEHKYALADSEVIVAKYLKVGSNMKIYSISPVGDKKSYDISQSGGSVVYQSKDGHLWILYNDGTSKKITPDNYESVVKAQIQKDNPNYIWADDPVITFEGSVRFISNLPDTSSSPKKSIWEINIENGSMKRIFTPASDIYKILGYREDGRLVIIDGDTMACVNLPDSSVQSINVKNKSLISLSPDGTKILYMKKDNKNVVDYSKLYMIDSYGNNPVSLPNIEGYNATDIGSWDYSGTRYAFIIKPVKVSKDKVAVINFDEHLIQIGKFSPETDVTFSEKSRLKWSEDYILSVDTGDDIVTIQIK